MNTTRLPSPGPLTATASRQSARLPERLNVLVLARASAANLRRICEVAPGRLQVTSAWDDFYAEIERDWSDTMVRRYAGPPPQESLRSRTEIESLLENAHVMLMGLPFPRSMATRARNLIWAHFPFAGTSTLWGSDWWQAQPLVTSSRGLTDALPIAETAVAAAFMFARKLDMAVSRTASRQFDAVPFDAGMRLVAGKTMGIIGLGGIGSHIARLSRAWGMRVIATRQSASCRQYGVEGVDELLPPQSFTICYRAPTSSPSAPS